MSYNILIVDDSRVTRKVIAQTLHLSGLSIETIHEAGNGKEAMEVLENSWIDLVLADINMPVMSGVQLVDEMARQDMLESIPVIIVSTERSVTRIRTMKAKGVCAYLQKPFTPENIKEIVEKVLGGLGVQEVGVREDQPQSD